jgi:hypothetical protein
VAFTEANKFERRQVRGARAKLRRGVKTRVARAWGLAAAAAARRRRTCHALLARRAARSLSSHFTAWFKACDAAYALYVKEVRCGTAVVGGCKS